VKGRPELRRRVEQLDDVDLDRAIEAAVGGRFDIVERILAAVAPPRETERPDPLRSGRML